MIAQAAGANLKPVTMELGGKSPNIVFDDADFDPALIGTLAGIFGATGQTCIAGSRLIADCWRAEGPGLDRGFFVQPTIFADVRNDMKVAAEEIFGPVLSIIPFADEDEAEQIANDTPYGLARGIWSENIRRCMRMMRAISSGVIWVNTYLVAAPQAPFGGCKESGYGRVRGDVGFDGAA